MKPRRVRDHMPRVHDDAHDLIRDHVHLWLLRAYIRRVFLCFLVRILPVFTLSCDFSMYFWSRF